jgi:hypothetical protein
MESEPSKERQRLYAAAILLVILVSHLNALYTFGATFWIDSLGYTAIGDALLDPARLKSFYAGAGFWNFSHYGPGLPSFWFIMKLLPIAWQWPFLAIVQHLVAAASCWLAFAWSIPPNALSLCGVALLSLLPFYESGHQMLMTESFTSSFLLIAVALAIRLTTKWSDRLFWLLLLDMFLITQFRSYFGIIASVLALLVLIWSTRWRSARVIAIPVALGISMLAFPTYRLFLTGRFFLPSWGANSLYFALRADPEPSSNLLPAFEEEEFPPEYPAEQVLQKGLELLEVRSIIEYWTLKGLTDAQIKSRIDRLVSRLYSDGIRPTINRALFGLNSSGFTLPYKLGPATYRVTRGKNLTEEWKFQLDYYRWFSWIDSGNYQASFNYFYRSPQRFFPGFVETQKELLATLEPYVKYKPSYLRDPLLLGVLPVDVWCSFGIIGIVLLAVSNSRKLAILLMVPVGINFVVTAASALPNVRYAYALIPIYFLAMVVGLEALRSKRVARLRPKSALEQ